MDVNMPYGKLLLGFYKHWAIIPAAATGGFIYIVWTFFSDLVVPEIGLQVMLATAFLFDWTTGMARALHRHFKKIERFDKWKFMDGTFIKPVTLAAGGAIFALMSNSAPHQLLHWVEPAYFISYTIMECLSALANLGKIDLAKGMLRQVRKALPESWHFLLPKSNKWLNNRNNNG
jgi:hypothetical protein